MNTTTKEWRPIPGLPHFFASSDGEVWREPHVVVRSNGHPYRVPGKMMGVVSTTRGYMIFPNLKKNGRRSSPKTLSNHQLICLAFHGPAPPWGEVVMHLDDNPLNNRPENLRWGTIKENGNTPRCKQLISAALSGDNHWKRRRARTNGQHP